MTLKGIELCPWEDDFTLPDKFNMVSLLLERHIQGLRAHKTAIHYGKDKITYHELGAQTNRVGNALAGLGIEPGERVILLLHDRPEFMTCFLGAMKIGAVPVPCNVMSTAADWKYFITDSEAAILVVEKDLLSKLAPELGDCPKLKHVLVCGGEAEGYRSLSSLTTGSASELDVYPTSALAHSYWLYTSGTTGRPKGVVHLHKDLVYAVETWGRHVMDFQPEDIVYCVSRLFFSYGLNNSLYLPLYYGGSVVLSPDRPAPETVIETVERYHPTVLFSVPTAYGQLLNHLDLENISPDFGSLRMCVSAGEALPGPLLDRWTARFDTEILDGIGSSEVSFIYISNRPGEIKRNSCGRVLHGYTVELLDENGSLVPKGEVGDLWVKSKSLAAEYWNLPEVSAETFKEGWMKTGDRFSRDEDGYYFYFGRSDDTLKVGGIWVSPLEVEEALLAHDAVAECAVVGRKDDMNLIKPQAFITLKTNIKPSSELASELQGFVKQRLAPYKYPRWIDFVEILPKTSTGKIQRYKLREK